MLRSPPFSILFAGIWKLCVQATREAAERSNEMPSTNDQKHQNQKKKTNTKSAWVFPGDLLGYRCKGVLMLWIVILMLRIVTCSKSKWITCLEFFVVVKHQMFQWSEAGRPALTNSPKNYFVVSMAFFPVPENTHTESSKMQLERLMRWNKNVTAITCNSRSARGCNGEKNPHVRNFPPAILVPEMAAPILWAPGIFWLFLQENPP